MYREALCIMIFAIYPRNMKAERHDVMKTKLQNVTRDASADDEMTKHF